jgi:hypothetical protein
MDRNKPAEKVFTNTELTSMIAAHSLSTVKQGCKEKIVTEGWKWRFARFRQMKYQARI